ncbi:oxidoreductase [Ilyonectria robusta]|uniref:oxidoreductase n=1 Tax=Ilyonectria robusta TaxID=1079257 RepID=UPI001E8DAF62|nr:oxidoreductase [Ilyonectria robusta]KAH8683829.1 oxidoreductase [Ilyonectria robusta]
MTVGTAEIPVLDISSLKDDDPQTAESLVAAFVRHGFVYIRSLEKDIATGDINQAFAISKEFFDSPAAEKAKTPLKDASYALMTEMGERANTWQNKGWGGVQSETLDPKLQVRGDFKEVFNLGEFVEGKAQQPLPKSLASHEQEIGQFGRLCHALCVKLLRLLAIGLKIDDTNGSADWFAARHAPEPGTSSCTLRLLWYPSVAENDDYEPDGAHTDYGSITLLFQRPGQPGLEVLTPDKKWAPVPVFPPGTESDASPPILVNIGDLLSYWTNSLLKSTVHRVIFPKESRRGGEDRYSIAYFCHPFSDAKLLPVPSPMILNQTEGLQERDALTAREHLLLRLAATRD